MKVLEQNLLLFESSNGSYTFDLTDFQCDSYYDNLDPVLSPEFKVANHTWQVKFWLWPTELPFQLIRKTKSSLKANYKVKILSQQTG